MGWSALPNCACASPDREQRAGLAIYHTVRNFRIDQIPFLAGPWTRRITLFAVVNTAVCYAIDNSYHVLGFLFVFQIMRYFKKALSKFHVTITWPVAEYSSFWGNTFPACACQHPIAAQV